MARMLRERAWRKSSYSDAQGNGDCVEIADTGDAVAVRDTKRRDAGALSFDQPAWHAFLRTQSASCQQG